MLLTIILRRDIYKFKKTRGVRDAMRVRYIVCYLFLVCFMIRLLFFSSVLKEQRKGRLAAPRLSFHALWKRKQQEGRSQGCDGSEVHSMLFILSLVPYMLVMMRFSFFRFHSCVRSSFYTWYFCVSPERLTNSRKHPESGMR